MWSARAAYATAALSAAIGVACSNGHPAASTPDDSNPRSTERAGTLSVADFRFSGWHDDSYHYLPALSVTAPSTGRPVFVQRVDFTADDGGTRRLLKGIRYEVPRRIEPGSTAELVSDAGAADPTEIASVLGLAAISAVILFADDEGRTGIVSAAARVPDVPDHACQASLVIRDFAIGRRQHQGRFLYWPRLTLTETSGRSPASIKKITFQLLDIGAAGQVLPLWRTPDVAAGDTLKLVTGSNGQAPWFEIDSAGDAARVSVAISFVDDAGRGGLVTAIAQVGR